MSIKLPKFNKKTVLFDTVETAPSAFNYGKQRNYKRVDNVTLYNSQTMRISPMFETAISGPSASSPTESAGVTASAHGDTDIDIDDNKSDEESHSTDDEHSQHDTTKFGTFDGVFGRCLLCMWGVIMFLRTGWIVGNAGIWQTSLVMILSASITMFTTLSLSAICTNGEISHGGPYFLISRSLGPQFGGVIGLLFAVGNCVGVALHLVGFSEAIVSIYYPKTFFNNWDIVLYAEIGLLFLFLISLRGVGSIIKFNLVLLALMVISIIVFFIGTFIMTDKKADIGFTGYSSATFNANWNAAYLPGNNFLTMVAIFFPSVTGCMAGANISGDLKKPSVNIPVGTISAVIFSMVVYIIIAWVLGGSVLREMLDADGNHIDGTGLYWNYVIMSDISLFRPLVDMGIYASTFSSATSCFVAAPRIFKAVCDDGLFPIFRFFAVGRKKDNEPVRCYVLVVFICALIMLSGDINFIAPMVTNFFLITYALVNYSVFAWDISKSPGWRPSFKYYSPYLSLFATVQSVLLMFLIDWPMALVTVCVGGICYYYIGRRNVSTNWGTTVESKLYQQSCKIALKYQKLNTEHAKITRPTFLILLFENNQNEVTALFKLAEYLNYSKGLIFIANIMVGSLEDIETAKEYSRRRKSYKNHNLSPHILDKCIMETCISDDYETGTKHILQSAGMGAFKPNVFMIQIDCDQVEMQINELNLSHDTAQPMWFTNLRNALLTDLSIIMIPNNFSLEHIYDVGKNHTGTIDIWWLFDDGGLTVLTGYLLTKHKSFKNYKLRIMALDEVGFEDTREMVYLMNKLRINAHIEHVQTVKADDDDTNGHQPPAYGEYMKNMMDGQLGEVGNGNDNDNDAKLDNNDDEPLPEKPVLHQRVVSEFAQQKIKKYKRVGQTIEKYSKDAKLCLVTMPYPRKKYEWWEYSHIIHDMTPRDVTTMFIRGTQDQVLTFFF